MSELKLRTAGLLDLAKVEQLYNEAGRRLTDSAPPVRLWSLLSRTVSALLPLTQETLLYVCESRGRVAGFIQASSLSPSMRLPGATSLQVLNLCVRSSTEADGVAQALVEHLCNQALAHGVHRLLVRIPLDDPLTPVFRLNAFRQYATEALLYSESPEREPANAPRGLRPARGRDDRRVYHLYRKVTPLGVAQVEAPTYAQWRGLKDDWAHPLRDSGDSGLEQVVEREEIVAWMRTRLSGGARPHTLAFMVLPEHDLVRELVDTALSQLEEHPGPIWSSLRHYDSLTIDALRRRGFTTIAHQALMVRELAIRAPVREKALVPSFG